MWTHAFDRYVAPARRHPALWRLLLGVLIASGAYIGAVLLTFGLAEMILGPGGAGAFMQSGSAASVVALLATFGGLWLGVAAAVRLLHRRPHATLIGEAPLRGFAGAALVAFAVLSVSALLLPTQVDLVRAQPTAAFLQALLPALAAIALQTGAEEVAFRGYLQSQLAARFAHPLVWMGLPSVLFGLAHYDPAGAGANAWWIVAATGLFGLAAADLTRVTGGIGAAWGLHFANNCLALMVVALDDTLGGLALWRAPFGPDDPVLRPLLVQDMILVGIVWACIRLWLARGAAGDDAGGG